MTNAEIHKLRAKAWEKAQQAQEALAAYAGAAEDHEMPRMSDDAVDAADLAATVRKYDYRYAPEGGA